MNLVIIDYGSGNLRSASKALERVKSSGSTVCVTKDPDVVASADYLILPGVGAFPDCKKGITALPGMIDAIAENVVSKGRPFMGICVGMQLMSAIGHEYETTNGFGWLPGEVVKIKTELKLPHMGWNELSIKSLGHPVFKNVHQGAFFYFVHSFHMQLKEEKFVLATTDYGDPIAAVVGKDNMIGTQFHPEKSQKMGLLMLENFLNWRP
ncbi:imidazole glycerol phosphate synthase subunit HisH [Rhodospirillaceae bacterium]|nr:imidazole glycerol phosphate synthase subunit HisH [Rhodospirillaceae bacterium]